MKKHDITILYVEDALTLQQIGKALIEPMCQNLLVASDGVEGLKLFKEHKPDIVISDIQMPNMDGLEMSKAIKEINPEQHIILISAHSDSEYFIKSIDMQIDGYILKPINVKTLSEKITNIVKYIDLKKENIKQQQLLIEQSRFSSMGEITNMIAHQWRQPLNVLAIDVQKIPRDFKRGLIDIDYLDTFNKEIMTTIDGMSSTIDNFISLFKSDDQKNNFMVKDVIKQTVVVLIDRIKKSNVNISLKGNDFEQYSIKSEFLQVILNIITNSLDAFDANSVQEPKINIYINSDERTILIEDNAGGIEDAILPKVFDPYFSTRSKNGAGIGLYMSKLIIESHIGGEIKISNKNDGSCVQLSL